MESTITMTMPPVVNRLTRFKIGALCPRCHEGKIVCTDFRVWCDHCKAILAESIFTVDYGLLPVGATFFLPMVGAGRAFVKGTPRELLDPDYIEAMVAQDKILAADLIYANALEVEAADDDGRPLWVTIGKRAGVVPVGAAMMGDRFGLN